MARNRCKSRSPFSQTVGRRARAPPARHGHLRDDGTDFHLVGGCSPRRPSCASRRFQRESGRPSLHDLAETDHYSGVTGSPVYWIISGSTMGLSWYHHHVIVEPGHLRLFLHFSWVRSFWFSFYSATRRLCRFLLYLFVRSWSSSKDGRGFLLLPNLGSISGSSSNLPVSLSLFARTRRAARAFSTASSGSSIMFHSAVDFLLALYRVPPSTQLIT